MEKTSKYWSAIGLLLLIFGIVQFWRYITEITSTQLYTEDAMRELQTENGFERIEEIRKGKIKEPEKVA